MRRERIGKPSGGENEAHSRDVQQILDLPGSAGQEMRHRRQGGWAWHQKVRETGPLDMLYPGLVAGMSLEIAQESIVRTSQREVGGHLIKHDPPQCRAVAEQFAVGRPQSIHDGAAALGMAVEQVLNQLIIIPGRQRELGQMLMAHRWLSCVDHQGVR